MITVGFTRVAEIKRPPRPLDSILLPGSMPPLSGGWWGFRRDLEDDISVTPQYYVLVCVSSYVWWYSLPRVAMASTTMAACRVCEDPLALQVDAEDDESDEPRSVPNDLTLPCGCHFHW